MGATISLALTILGELPSLIAAGQDVIALINTTYNTIAGAQAANRDITDAEWLTLDQMITDLRAQAAAP
jgi:hypothetical protein